MGLHGYDCIQYISKLEALPAITTVFWGTMYKYKYTDNVHNEVLFIFMLQRVHEIYKIRLTASLGRCDIYDDIYVHVSNKIIFPMASPKVKGGFHMLINQILKGLQT